MNPTRARAAAKRGEAAKQEADRIIREAYDRVLGRRAPDSEEEDHAQPHD